MQDGLFSGNSRATGIAIWLKDVPPDAERLAVVVVDGERSETLKLWDLEAVSPALGGNINELIEEHSAELAQSITARVQWLDGRNEVLASRTCRVRLRRSEGERDLYEGNAQSVLAQTQAHQQVLLQNFVQAMQYVAQTSVQAQTDAITRAVEAESRAAELQREIEALREEMIVEGAQAEIMKAQDADPVKEKMGAYMDVAFSEFMKQRIQKAAAAKGEGDKSE